MARCDLSTRYDPSHRAFAAITRVTLENSPPKGRAAKNIENNPMQSNRPPTAGSSQPEKQLDPSGKSPAYLHHSEIL
jgi:hypothetical protein